MNVLHWQLLGARAAADPPASYFQAARGGGFPTRRKPPGRSHPQFVALLVFGERWLQYYVNQKYYSVKKEIEVSPKQKGKLIVEIDEMWSFVGFKGNKLWIWFAIDSLSKEIIGVHVGSRSREDARMLWKSLPPVYRQCAVCYTDFWESYEKILPSKRHRSVGKESGKTNDVERLNNTARQRIARLVRNTLSFSKKLENHIGAIWYFVHEYNTSLQN